MLADLSVPPIRVMIVDHEDVVRRGFRAIVDGMPGMTTVGEADTEIAAAALVDSARPDLVLLEVTTARRGMDDAVRRLGRNGEAAVIALTSRDDDEALYDALRAGVAGYLLKEISEPDFVSAVRAVAAGGAVISPRMTRRLIDRFEIVPPRDRKYYSKVFETLSDREFDVLLCIGRGMSNRATAAALHVAETTIKSHVSSLMAKLGVTGRTNVALLAHDADQRKAIPPEVGDDWTSGRSKDGSPA